MNGRIYDPVLGRFLSPDVFIQAPDFTQSFNRYSYVFNNPLKLTDPSGYWSGWDDLIVAGTGFAFGYVSYGLTTGEWGWGAVAAGGIGAATFMLGYYTGGTATMANAYSSIGLSGYGNLVATGYAAQTAATSTVNLFMPTFTIPLSEDGYMSMSVSPAITPNGATMSGTFRSQGEYLGWSIGANTSGSMHLGYNVNLGKSVNVAWYSTWFTGDMAQQVGGVRFTYKEAFGGKHDLSFAVDEDHKLFGVEHADRYRTGGFQLSYGNFVIAGRVITNDVPLNERETDEQLRPFYLSPFGNLKLAPNQVLNNGEVHQSSLMLGYKTQFGVMALEHHHPFYQHYLQNGIHSWTGDPFFQARRENRLSVNTYRNNPYSIYYY